MNTNFESAPVIGTFSVVGCPSMLWRVKRWMIGKTVRVEWMIVDGVHAESPPEQRENEAWTWGFDAAVGPHGFLRIRNMVDDVNDAAGESASFWVAACGVAQSVIAYDNAKSEAKRSKKRVF